MKSTAKSLLFLAVCLLPLIAHAKDVHLIEVDDFASLGREAAKQRLPILLMFASQDCVFCTRVEEDFLKPMLRSGLYSDRALIRQLHTDSDERVRDFDGSITDAASIADRYGISLTPTVLFIDGKGSELVPRRIGLSTPDYYGAFLDDGIDQALNILRRSSPLRAKVVD